MNHDFGGPDILSRREAALYLGICKATLDRLDIPKTRIRHRVMFRREVLNQWIDEHTDNTKKSKGGKK